MPSPSQYAQDFLNGARGRLSSADAARVDFSEGSKWDALAGGVARAFTRLESVLAQAFDAHVLDRAQGSEVDAYCTRRGPIRRIDAVKAKGTCVLTRPTVAAGAGTIYADTQIRVPYQGAAHLFRVTEDTPVRGDAPGVTVTVPVEAMQAGIAASCGLVSAGLSLTGSPAALFDATLLPTSINATGGVDAEQDDPLKARQRLWEQAKRGGLPAAIKLAALSTPGVAHVVLASRYHPGSGGEGVVYVGDANWQSNDTLLDAVAVSLESARAFGPSATVYGMTVAPVTLSAIVTMARSLVNYDQVALRAAVIKRALDYFSARVDPFAWTRTMLGARMSHADDDIVSVDLTCTVGGVTSTFGASPFSASALLLSGGYPSSLTVYTTDASLVSVQLAGAA